MAGPDGDQRRDGLEVRFEPLSPASRPRLVAGLILGPILWLAVFAITAWLLDESFAIVIGFAVTAASFAIAVLLLAAAYVARRREEKRFADGG